MKMSNMKILEQHQQQQSVSQNQQQQQQQQQQHQQHQQNIPLINTPNIGNNMVPIISVTAHSPGAKYYSILEDTLNQLQNIRENVVQMKNSTVQVQLNSSRLFSSCPSLSNLSLNNTIGGGMWSTMEQYPINSNRRKSWTAIEDLTECTKSSHKSVSLSSLDSEEQESIHAAERNRSSRNSTGGISTHSLNEAELARDFERIAAKRNLAPVLISRISLKKSISTPSIAPLRIPGTKEENNITTTRLISDSDDDNLDDETLLCVRDKIEVYADHPEKRRKRGSLFFRKKKDKTKSKSQSTTCDVCGATINLSSYKEHSLECKQKVSKHQSSKSGSGKKNSSNSGKKMTGCYSPWKLVANKLGVTSHASHSTHHDDGKDFYDGHSQTDHLNYSDETPLIRIEFLNEPPIGPQDLVTDPMLGIDLDEHDSWSPGVPKDIMKSLKEKQVKRQEHIYEFIMTEKHHCQTLLVMQKIFVESLQKHFNRLNIDRMFPKLAELTELHIGFLKKLRIRQKENVVVNSISDILLDFFSSTSANRLKNAYGEFCSNHRSALEKFKYCMTSDQTFTEWYKHCLTNPLLKKKGIPECILFVTQRLTKYPLLIDPLLKSSREDQIEQETLQKAMALVKEILVDVNARVAEKEKQDRQLEIFKCIDVKSFAMYKNKQFRKSDIGIGTNRKLKFEGYATLMQGRSKMQNVQVVVLSDCLFFLQENSHNKYTFFTPENKAGVVSLQKLLIREKAGTESRGIYIISSNPALPEMYELKVQNPKDKNVWIQAIRTAVLECPPDDYETDDLTAEEKQRLIDAKQADMRELIEKLHQKDIEQAILLEEKILLQLSLLKERKNTTETTSIPNAEEFLANFGSYKDLITDDCDTIEIWKRVLNTIQKISQLASSLYTAATGLPVSRSTSSVGEKQSEAYSSPTLPKRAETFGGFDERRNKNNIPWRDAVLSTLPITPLPTHNHHNHHHNQNQNDSKKTTSITLSNSSELINISGCASDANLNCLSVNSCYTNNNNSSNSSSSTLRINTDNISLKDNNYAALQVSHHLHTLLCIISQQMTAIQNLQTQLVTFRGNKSLYKHNDQLEELRNLQDKLQEEKHVWLKQKEQKEKELEDLQKSLEAQQKQIKAEQEDVKQQREQLYRKMELLSNQGILLSPNSPLSITTATVTTATTASIPTNTSVCNEENINIQSSDENHQCGGGNSMEGNFSDRRKDKWRTSSIPKTPPVNLLSATNAPKVNQASIKQQIPMKLSSLSSTKSDRIPNPNNTITSPIITSSGGITQMLPLKLADKKTNQNITPNHSRTGSSPAIIQQPTSQQLGNPATRTNTYPKLPERYRVRTSDVGQINQSSSSALLVQQKNQIQNNIMNLTTTLSSQSTSSSSSSTLSSIICHSTRNSSIYSSLTTSSGNCSTIDVTSSSATVVSNKLQTLSSSSTCNHIMSSSSPSLISMSSTASSSLATVAADNSSGVTTAVTDKETKKQQQQQQQQKQQSPDEEEIYF